MSYLTNIYKYGVERVKLIGVRSQLRQILKYIEVIFLTKK